MEIRAHIPIKGDGLILEEDKEKNVEKKQKSPTSLLKDIETHVEYILFGIFHKRTCKDLVQSFIIVSVLPSPPSLSELF